VHFLDIYVRHVIIPIVSSLSFCEPHCLASFGTWNTESKTISLNSGYSDKLTTVNIDGVSEGLAGFVMDAPNMNVVPDNFPESQVALESSLFLFEKLLPYMRYILAISTQYI
jgi:hypothetical protein